MVFEFWFTRFFAFKRLHLILVRILLCFEHCSIAEKVCSQQHLKLAKIKGRKYLRKKVIFDLFYSVKGKVRTPSGILVLNCPS